jgi:hypothetical protein
MFASLTGLFVAPAAASAAAVGGAEDTSAAAATAINQLRNTIANTTGGIRGAIEEAASPTNLGASGTITAIRKQQHEFLLANRKYPDFMEVGTGVWEDIYDFHIKHSLPPTAGRLADGRYTIGFMFTTLIMRVDQAASYIGFPYDAEPVTTPRR